MIKNYIKLALRNLWKNKLVTSINLLGLTVGIGFSLLLFMYVGYENSYDSFINSGDRVYRMILSEKGQNGRKIALSGNTDHEDLSTNYAGIEEAVKIRNFSYSMFPAGDAAKNFNVDVLFASENFFDVMTYPVLMGNQETLLNDPSSLVITDDLAMKLFGKTDVVGEQITIDATEIVIFKKDMRISGVVESLGNAHIKFEAVIPWAMQEPNGMVIADAFFGRSLFNYVKVKEGTKIEDITKIKNVQILSEDSDAGYEAYFQPLSEMYLDSSDISFLTFETGNKSTLNTLLIVAFVILFVACINYVNLQTAKGSGRSLEVGVKKVLGAEKSSLILQFLTESILVTLMASVVSILMIDLILPFFNQLTGKSFSMSLLFEQGMIFWLVVISVLTSVLSGMYPAFVLSSFKVTTVLKGKSVGMPKNSRFRRSLLFVQFGISISLLALTIIIFQQSQFISQKELGFNKEQVVNFSLSAPNINSSIRSFQAELEQNPIIRASTVSTDILGTGYTNNSGPVFSSIDTDLSTSTTIFGVDHTFVDTYELKLVDGRDFDLNIGSDSSGIVVNQAFVNALNIEDPIGQTVSLYHPTQGPKYKILGVLQDFNFQRLHQEVNPVALRIAERNLWNMSVRIAPESMEAGLEYIEEVWTSFEPEKPISLNFVDQQFAKFYEDDRNMLSSITFFSSISILLTILGLFAMTVFSIDQKVKEIGIRKVLGARGSDVLRIISKEFVIVFVVALVVSVPLVYYFGNEWLSKFAYRIDWSFWPVVISGLVTISAIFIIISVLTHKAAQQNPIKSLRTE